MGIEEQKEEREVLDSIFPDEITGSSRCKYLLTISLIAFQTFQIQLIE
jgi:hypothetical protein